MTHDIDYWLSEVTVTQRDMADPSAIAWWPTGFPWLVEYPDGGQALFTTEVDAFRFRLDYINRKLNP